jgi:hypothetical protein
MPNLSWGVVLGGEPYNIELNHVWFSGKPVIRVNSVTVYEAINSVNKIKSEHPFQIGTYPCKIVVTMRLGITYDLYIDEKLEATEKFSQWQIFKTMPLWVWPFYVILAYMNLIGLNAASRVTKSNVSVLSIVIFVAYFGFLIAIWAYSSDQNRSVWIRILLCIALCIAYLIFILFSGCSCIGLSRL